MSYNGHYRELVPVIRRMAADGHKPQIISEVLSDHDISANMVAYILRSDQPKKPKPAKWQVWTPEMQEAEFQREYSGT